MAEMYGGDEVNAAVIDTGGMWTRVGLAGALSPAITIPSAYVQTEDQRGYGDIPLLVPNAQKEVKNPIKESTVDDWDAVEGLWSFGLKEAGVDVEESPLLFTEQLWSPDTQRKQTLELALEKFGAPAAYIAKSPVCSLFSAGRGTGIVVDIGHQTVGVAPIVDGLPLFKPARRSLKAGAFLDSKIVDLIGMPVPSFRVGGRNPFVERKVDATDSFARFHSLRVVQDFKESMAQVTVSVGSPPQLVEADTRAYELPDGNTLEYGEERAKLGDELFADGDQDEVMDGQGAPEKDVKEEPSGAAWSSKGLSSLVVDAINACDVDLRANLANNVVITGGSSLVQKLTERLNADITSAIPGTKVRIHAPGNFTERKNSAWIGGSILGSLGTFHQLWVSRKEYDEIGADQLIQKRFG